MEWATDDAPGGLIAKYTFTRLYGLALAVYAVCSSAVVMLAAGIAALRKRALRPGAVVLCHVIPVGLVLVMLYFGVHDVLQNMLAQPAQLPAKSGYRPLDDRVRRMPVAPRRPAKAPLYREATSGPMTPRHQTPAPDTVAPEQR